MKKIKLLLILSMFVFSFGQAQDAYEGFTLYNALNSTTTYLIDMEGNTVHSWNCNYSVANTVYLLEDGSILRTGRDPSASLNGGAAGGYIEIYDWDGNLTWQYKYSSSDYLLHHDVEMLPNGNVIAIAWEVKSGSEAIAQGSSSNDEIWPLHIIEVQPTGTYTGDIVWEWHAWDHLVQDYSSSKPNYGVVADHPELIDLNNLDGSKGGPGGPPGGGDWIHANGIDYNDSLDQIVVSSHTLHEIYVIDHSTTTAEAAGHTGGNSGKGGDILYRWGNPQGYNQGSSSDQIFYVIHNGQWIDYDLPGGGDFMVFNNGDGRPGGNSSSIDQWTPPVDAYGNYDYTSGAFMPTALTWTHTCTNYSNHLSAAQRVANGNTLITEGTNGRFYETTPEGVTVWEYNIGMQECTKALRYGCDYPGLEGLNLDCNCDVNGTAYYDECDTCVGGNTGLEPCVVGIKDVDPLRNLTIYPNPSQGIYNISCPFLNESEYEVAVYDMLGNLILISTNNRRVDLSSFENGSYIIHVVSNNGFVSKKQVSLLK